MAYFDEVFEAVGLEDTNLSQPEAFAAIAVGAAAIDGKISDVEIENIVTYLRRMKLYKQYSTEQFVKLFDKVLGVLKYHGAVTLIQAASKVLSPPLRETAYAMAVDVTLSDGVLKEREDKLLRSLRQDLNLSEELAKTIIRVIEIKNRG